MDAMREQWKETEKKGNEMKMNEEEREKRILDQIKQNSQKEGKK